MLDLSMGHPGVVVFCNIRHRTSDGPACCFISHPVFLGRVYDS